jgi:hypothetical protein
MPRRHYGTVKPRPGTPIQWGHPLSRGLVGAWMFNQGSGNPVNDVSQVVSGASTPPPPWTVGPRGPTTNRTAGPAAWTPAVPAGLVPADRRLSAHIVIRPSAASGATRYDVAGAWQDPNRLWLFTLGITDAIRFYSQQSDATYQFAASTASYAAGQELHLTGVIDFNAIRLYRDGVAQTAGSYSSNLPSPPTLLNIGKSTDNENYVGVVELLYLWHGRSLLASHALELYADPFCIYAPSGPTVFWFGQPSSGGAQSLTAPTIASGASLYAPTLAVGSVTLALPMIASGATLYACTVAPGPVTLTPPTITAGSSLYAPVVAAGATALILPLRGPCFMPPRWRRGLSLSRSR